MSSIKSALPALPSAPDFRSVSERVNVLIKDYNLRHSSCLVAELPAADSVPYGQRTFVTDANATTFNSIVAGGGVNNIGVRSDSTNWRIG
jgi:hypothetical protein